VPTDKCAVPTARSLVSRSHTAIQKEENSNVLSNFSAGLHHYYYQRHGLSSVQRRALECVELYLHFMSLQALVLK
jgi:hypothetical protein